MSRTFWWKARARPHEALFDQLRGLEEDQREIHLANIRHAKLYGNCELYGPSLGTRGRRYAAPRGEASDNIIHSVCEAATAQIARQRLKVRVMTDGGDFTDQQQAKLLDKFIFGVYQTENVWDEEAEAFLDATIFGTGCLHIFPDAEQQRIRVVRVPIDEIVVDEMECTSGPDNFRNLYRRRYVNREELADMFPEARKEIMRANFDRPYVRHRKVDPDLAVLVEAIHRPTRDFRDGEDKLSKWAGRRILAVDTVTLADDAWTRADVPYEFVRWTRLPSGFYGRGIAAEIAPIQLRLNRLHRFIDRAQDLIAVPRIFLNRLSRIAPNAITNEIAQIIEYSGQQPVFHVPQAVGQEIYAQIDRLEQRAYDRTGVSKYTSTGTVPTQFESGRAIREHADQVGGRFQRHYRRLERLNEDVGHKIVRAACQAKEEGLELYSLYRGVAVAEQIDFEEVGYEDGRFVMKIESASVMTYTPAGRLEAVSELYNAGFIDRDEARRLLAHPDIGRADQIDNAEEENADKVCEQLRRGVWASPWPLQNLTKVMLRVMHSALDAENQGAEPEVIDLHVRWIEQAKFLADAQMGEADTAALAAENVAQMQAAAAGIPQAMGPMGMPPGQPVPPMGPGLPPGMVPGGMPAPPPMMLPQ